MSAERPRPRKPILVYCRTRPIKRTAICVLCRPAESKVDFLDCSGSYHRLKDTYTFSRVFPPKIQQSDVYDEVVRGPLSSFVQKGTSGALFACGATGSGKTYTISGFHPTPGLLQSSFAIVHSIQPGYALRVSYLEIYNDQVFDLLAPDRYEQRGMRRVLLARDKLKLVETPNPSGPTFMEARDCIVERVQTEDNLVDLLRRGRLQRRTFETAYNTRSSRSHAIFTFRLYSQTTDRDVARFHFVDLAGGERRAQSEERMHEGNEINAGHLAFGVMIRKLHEGQALTFRGAKIVRMFKGIFTNPTANVSMICHVNPSQSFAGLTEQVLRFAAVARVTAPVAARTSSRWGNPMLQPPELPQRGVQIEVRKAVAKERARLHEVIWQKNAELSRLLREQRLRLNERNDERNAARMALAGKVAHSLILQEIHAKEKLEEEFAAEKLQLETEIARLQNELADLEDELVGEKEHSDSLLGKYKELESNRQAVLAKAEAERGQFERDRSQFEVDRAQFEASSAEAGSQLERMNEMYDAEMKKFQVKRSRSKQKKKKLKVDHDRERQEWRRQKEKAAREKEEWESRMDRLREEKGTEVAALEQETREKDAALDDLRKKLADRPPPATRAPPAQADADWELRDEPDVAMEPANAVELGPGPTGRLTGQKRSRESSFASTQLPRKGLTPDAPPAKRQKASHPSTRRPRRTVQLLDVK